MLGNIFDDITAKAHEQCISSAPQLAELDAKVEDIKANWNPTGYYTSAQMRQILGATMNLVNNYHNTVMTARARYDTALLAIAEQTFNDIGSQALDYTDAWRKADAAGGTPISAPGLKAWVVKATIAMNQGMRAVVLQACDEPWWFSALASYTAFFGVLVDVVKAIAGIVVKAGQIVVDAVETSLKLWPIVKWGAIITAGLFAGVYAWNKIESAAEAGRRSINWSRWSPVSRIRAGAARVRALAPRRAPPPPVSGARYRRRRRRH